jgi:glycosyltransferase involved in cell wall biosynthesis
LMIVFPDSQKNPNLYTDLAHEYKKHGHNVFVCTIVEKKFNQKTCYENEYGIQVLRVRSADFFDVGFLKKGLSTITIPRNFIKAAKKYFKDVHFDVVIFPTPPVTLYKVVKYIKKHMHSTSYLILRDIFPQNARDLGLMKNNFLFNYFRRVEKNLYQISDFIGCMSKANIDYIIAHNPVKKEKCGLLPNWKKIDKSTQQTIDFRKKFGLKKKFVAVFGGVIGIAQELDFMLRLAKIYKNRSDILFLIVGEGNQKKKLMETITRDNVHNVMMKERLPSHEFTQLVRQADVGLVNLNRNFTIPNFPSKTLDYFEAGIPVLAATDPNTDYGEFLEKEAKAGLWSKTGDLESYQDNFEKLFYNESLRKKMGENGRIYLEENLTVDKTYQKMMNQIYSR